MRNTIQQHHASPSTTLGEHVRLCQIKLAREMEPRRAVYLDVKFWIILRDIVTGGHATNDQRELLDLLRSQVSAGLAFCPISESTFAELFKQRDSRTREATARLVDELSLGIALIPFDKRVHLEMKSFICPTGDKNDLRVPQQPLVWSKLSYVLGLVHPTQTGFDSATELAIQKAFFDHMWALSLSEMVQIIGEGMPPEDHFEPLAKRLNLGNAHHAQELYSYQQTYAIELRGGLDLFAPLAASVVCEHFENTTGQSVPRGGVEWDNLVQQWHAFLVAAFKKDEVKNALRTLHILICLHAAVRWNKAQQLEANDFYDFHHAAAALAYCDVFLTERSLKSMVTANHLALDTRFGCKVAASIEDAIVILRQQT